MKLKTLRDLKKEMADATLKSLGISFVGFVSSENLKQEAIKWIKYFKKKAEKEPYYVEFVLWIKHFFNITEEELKYIERKGKEIANAVDEEVFKQLTEEDLNGIKRNRTRKIKT